MIDKSREYQRLEVVATIDALTGALNRGAIDAVLQRAWLGYSQTGRAGGVIMADIDHFKLINDECGHAAGDAVLRDCVKRLSTQLRRATDTSGGMAARSS